MNSDRSLAAYYIIARQAWQNAMVFRANYFITLSREILFIILSIELWSALYVSPIGSLKFHQLITYLALTRMITTIDMEFVSVVQKRVLTGEIASELVRPIDYSIYLLCQEAGRYLHKLMFLIFPVYVFVFIMIGIKPPASVLTACLFGISLVFSFLIMFYINYITALSSFWITQLYSLNIFKGQIVRFFSGFYVPLWFFPEHLGEVIKWLPFSSIVFIPINIYLQDSFSAMVGLFLFVQLVWTVLLVLISRWIWNKAVFQITIGGG
ncbi:ABC transporter permease [Cohnella algarum]|uniref:ABC transporter permease n=1 Tax=Cohnella algarum TaxID=2044859 RepID=UPI00196879ED|nr:ABC-2 family transporter protein [Cohnella algarum]MBN2984746.1 ABC-2 family transporter protein [Cohnella algarum]